MKINGEELPIPQPSKAFLEFWSIDGRLPFDPENKNHVRCAALFECGRVAGIREVANALLTSFEAAFEQVERG